jgi:hypothetical protein
MLRKQRAQLIELIELILQRLQLNSTSAVKSSVHRRRITKVTRWGPSNVISLRRQGQTEGALTNTKVLLVSILKNATFF